jgi:hypothetical protein
MRSFAGAPTVVCQVSSPGLARLDVLVNDGAMALSEEPISVPGSVEMRAELSRKVAVETWRYRCRCRRAVFTCACHGGTDEGPSRDRYSALIVFGGQPGGFVR